MINPILSKDITTKSRSWKIAISVAIYLLILLAFTAIGLANSSDRGNTMIEPVFLKAMFDIIATTQLSLILLIIPIITGASISGERERQTLDLMLCSNMSTYTLIFGKIQSTISNVLILIFSALPFLGFTLVLGGITLIDVLIIYLYYIVISISVAAISIYMSSIFKKTVTSIIMTYVVLGILYCTPFLAAIYYVKGMHNYDYETTNILYTSFAPIFSLNPVYGFFSIITNNFADSVNHRILNASRWSVYLPAWLTSCGFAVLISMITIPLTKLKLTRKS